MPRSNELWYSLKEAQNNEAVLTLKNCQQPLHGKKTLKSLATEYSVSKVSIPSKVDEYRKEYHSDVKAKALSNLWKKSVSYTRKKSSNKLLGFL